MAEFKVVIGRPDAFGKQQPPYQPPILARSVSIDQNSKALRIAGIDGADKEYSWPLWSSVTVTQVD